MAQGLFLNCDKSAADYRSFNHQDLAAGDPRQNALIESALVLAL
jgi:hypothetical protein